MGYGNGQSSKPTMAFDWTGQINFTGPDKLILLYIINGEVNLYE